MSNILIIKHGSLGDIAQASGAIQDISENHKDDQIYLLTTKPYLEVFKKNPFIHKVILDKRLPRYNLIYLYFLMKELKKYNFSKVFDLQNSSRTRFYRKFIINQAPWSSTDTILEDGQKKTDFDQEPVLDRVSIQLRKSGIETEFTKNIDLSWAISDISRLIKQYANNDYILLFPFCSKKHKNKKWPFFKELIVKLKQDFKNKYPILLAPGPEEIQEAINLNGKVVLDNNEPIDIKTLISLIYNAKFIISNDTGPAHIASHLDKKGLALFGSHTSAKKVSLENFNFTPISVRNLNDLKVQRVLDEVKSRLN